MRAGQGPASSIVSKLLAIQLAIVVATVALAFAVLEYRTYQSSLDTLRQNLERLLDVQQLSYSQALWELDEDQIRALSNEIADHPAFAALEVVDESGTTLVQLKRPGRPQQFVSERKLSFDGRPLGRIRLAFHAAEVTAELKNDLPGILAILAVLILASASGVAISSRLVIKKPLGLLIDALISRRVYKEGMPHERAVDIIREGSDSHFDSDIVTAFLEIQDEFRASAARFSDSDTDMNRKRQYLTESGV